MTCTDWLLATSPEILMSACRKGPQLEPSTKWTHSAITFPLEFCRGRLRVSAEARIRSPEDPVSTCTWSISWQVPVPGTQILTVVYRVLTAGLFELATTVGPESTVTAWTFGSLVEPPPPPLSEEPPPPHPATQSMPINAVTRFIRTSSSPT